MYTYTDILQHKRLSLEVESCWVYTLKCVQQTVTCCTFALCTLHTLNTDSVVPFLDVILSGLVSF